MVHDAQSWMVSAWMSGVEMVESGVDHLSREGAYDTDAVSVADELWDLASELAHTSLDATITIDWFADEHLHRCPAFWTRSICGDAEGTDALSATSWRYCTCSTCTLQHERASWLFPPTPMLSRAVEKAARDGAYGIMVIPYMPGATWWSVLKNATVKTLEFHQQLLTLGPRTDRGVYVRSGWRLACFDFRAPSAIAHTTMCNCDAPTPQVIKHEDNGVLAQRELVYAQALLAHEWARSPEGQGGATQERRVE